MAAACPAAGSCRAGVQCAGHICFRGRHAAAERLVLLLSSCHTSNLLQQPLADGREARPGGWVLFPALLNEPTQEGRAGVGQWQALRRRGGGEEGRGGRRGEREVPSQLAMAAGSSRQCALCPAHNLPPGASHQHKRWPGTRCLLTIQPWLILQCQEPLLTWRMTPT